LDLFGQTIDPEVSARTAGVCLIAPVPGADTESARKLATRAVSNGRTHPYLPLFRLVKALGDYRTDQAAGALEQLNAIPPTLNRASLDNLVLILRSMADRKLDRADDARRSLDAARAAVEGTTPDPAKGVLLGDDWIEWLHVRLLLREADANMPK
jgi:hypothetical protein